MTSDNCLIKKKDFEFPSCWNNDVRINALFAPFRSKTINPTDWTSKMKFWTDLIESWCKHNKCPLVDISSLKNAFSRNGVIPACLEDVLQYLHSIGTLTIRDSIAFNETWKSWAVKMFLKVPLKWTYDTLKSTVVGRNNEAEIVYVHLPVIKFLGEDLMKQILPSLKGKLISFEDILKIWTANNEENTVLVLKWLQKLGLVGICESDGYVLVKFPKNGTKNVMITETDKGIYNLERQEKILENNIEKLELEKNAALEDTRKHINAKMKNLAKISLRRKKEIEKTIEKRMLTLDNIQALLHRIDQIKLDSEIIECYQTGLKTLKKVFKETGLNEETVTGTMSELEEGLNIGKEIEEAMSKPLDPSVEQNLEDELNELLLQDLPKVPDDITLTEDSKKTKEKKSEEQLKNKMEALSI